MLPAVTCPLIPTHPPLPQLAQEECCRAHFALWKPPTCFPPPSPTIAALRRAAPRQSRAQLWGGMAQSSANRHMHTPSCSHSNPSVELPPQSPDKALKTQHLPEHRGAGCDGTEHASEDPTCMEVGDGLPSPLLTQCHHCSQGFTFLMWFGVFFFLARFLAMQYRQEARNANEPGEVSAFPCRADLQQRDARQRAEQDRARNPASPRSTNAPPGLPPAATEPPRCEAAALCLPDTKREMVS